MPIEDIIARQPDPNAPPVFSFEECQKLILAYPKYGRLPNGEFVKRIGDQLGLAVQKLQSATQDMVNVQNEAALQKREREASESRLFLANQELVKAREEIEVLKSKIPKAVKAEPASVAAVTPVADPRKKRVKKAPVVQMPQKAANS